MFLILYKLMKTVLKNKYLIGLSTCRLNTEVEVYMGIWTPRAKPEVCKFTYTPTTRCLTYLNYVHCMACMVHCMATRCLTYLNYVHCMVHCMACMVHCMALMVHCMANGIIIIADRQ